MPANTCDDRVRSSESNALVVRGCESIRLPVERKLIVLDNPVCSHAAVATHAGELQVRVVVFAKDAEEGMHADHSQ
jgi:hypothetical protein